LFLVYKNIGASHTKRIASLTTVGLPSKSCFLSSLFQINILYILIAANHIFFVGVIDQSMYR
jgi:hypothetical protein